MVPIGTGNFKTFYDASKHNTIKHNKVNYKPKSNIIEEKIINSAERVNHPKKNEIPSILSFNLVDSIR